MDIFLYYIPFIMSYPVNRSGEPTEKLIRITTIDGEKPSWIIHRNPLAYDARRALGCGSCPGDVDVISRGRDFRLPSYVVRCVGGPMPTKTFNPRCFRYYPEEEGTVGLNVVTQQ